MSGTVAYLTKRFPRLSETFILDEILGLEAAGVPLRLYALRDSGERVVQPDVTRVTSPVRYLHAGGGWRSAPARAGAALRAHARLASGSPRRYLGVLAYIARRRRHLSTLKHFVEAGALAEQLERDGARHLHAAFAHGPASVAHFVHLLTGLPFSFGGHAKDIYLSAPDLLAKKIEAAQFVLTCSGSAAATLRGLAGPASDKVVLAYHGVDTTRFSPPDDDLGRPAAGPLRLLAVGRLVEKKGYPVLLEALAALVAQGRPVRCTIVGAGVGRPLVERLIAELALHDVVELAGARTHQEVAESFKEADVFVQASVVLDNGDRDGVPNSLLEAMASGLPVVASSVAGIPEVVAPGCGLLVPPGDAGALAGALSELAGDERLRARLGTAARAHVAEHFDRGRCAAAIAPLFGAGEPAVVRPPGRRPAAAAAVRP